MTSAPPRAVSKEPSPPRDRVGGRATVRPIVVTAVLVVHDGAAWLQECLDALTLQTRPPDRLIVVDTGSVDDSFQIVADHGRLRQVIGGVMTISASRKSTFGQAVGRAVEVLSSGSLRSLGSAWSLGSELSQAPSRAQWLWLLHDDSAAAPDALDVLLAAACRSPSVGVAGPKLTTWDDPLRLLEVGQQITRSGTRVNGPARGEPDQGQYDHRSDVLGVNSSGMLVRADVFDSLGGFDPAFEQFRDDLDLCWRAHLAGHRVVVVPRARVREAAASTNGQRSPELSAAAARRRDRRHVRQVALARCSPYAVPALALWIALASLASAAVLLMAKRPRGAWQELGDIGAVIVPWPQLAARLRLSLRRRDGRRVRRRDLRGLFAPPRVGFAHTIDTIRATIDDTVTLGSPRSGDDRVGRAHSLETGPVSDDIQSFEGRTRGVASRVLGHPGFLAVMVGVLLATSTWRLLLGALVPANGLGLTGGELLPVSTDAAGLWHAWLDGWHGAGLGNALEPAPYLPVLSAGAWVLEHLPLIDTSPPNSSAGVLITWLLAGAIPLSALTAYLGARVATRAPWPRAWAAMAWASLETLTTAQATGRLGAVIGHILMPLVAAGFACVARRSAGTPVTFGTAAALGVAGVFNPMLAALGGAVALVVMVLGHGATRVRAAVILTVPIGLSGPWILRLVDNPLLFLSGPGLTVWGGSASAPWQLALLHPGGPGSYPALLSAPIVLAGVVAMARRGFEARAPDSRESAASAPTSGAMTALALLVVTGLAVGVVSPHVIVGTVPSGMGGGAGGPITVWAGTGVDLAALGLITATVLGFAGFVGSAKSAGGVAHSGPGRQQIIVVPIVTTAVLAVAGAGVMASVAMAGWSGVGQELTARDPNTPAVAQDQAEGPLANRLLVMAREEGTIGYRLVGREPGPVIRDLPETGRVPNPLLVAAVGLTVGQNEATSAKVAHEALADQGIAFVAFRGASTEPLVRQLDATEGLTRLSDNKGLILWRVLPRDGVSSSRHRLEGADGSPLQSIDVTGDHGRTDVKVGQATPRATAPGATAPGATAPGRRLVAAEPARWADHARVTFAGREVSAVAGGGQPTYPLPSNGGQLSVSLEPTHLWWRRAQVTLLVLVLFMAVPTGSTRSRRTS